MTYSTANRKGKFIGGYLRPDNARYLQELVNRGEFRNVTVALDEIIEQYKLTRHDALVKRDKNDSNLNPSR
jgi:hypothetical protein